MPTRQAFTNGERQPALPRIEPVFEEVDPVRTFAELAVDKMTVDQQIRSLLMLHYPGQDLEALSGFMQTTGAGGFIVMGNNVPATTAELRALTNVLTLNSDFPALIAIDEEGGDVTRLPYDNIPGANTLRNEPPESSELAFSERASLLNSVGINVNFGIVADQTADPGSFIYSRSFGGDANQTAPRVVAAVEGEGGMVFSTLKHFPGHGSAPGDSHFSIPISSLSMSQWESTDAVPFQAGIDVGAGLVMFGHLSFPAIDSSPATLSSYWHEYLRNQMGFSGVIITDDMMMLQRSGVPELTNDTENAVRALLAGNDVLLYVLGADYAASAVNPDQIVAGLVDAVTSGRISAEQVRDSAIRVLTMRRSLNPEATSWIPPCGISCFVYVR